MVGGTRSGSGGKAEEQEANVSQKSGGTFLSGIGGRTAILFGGLLCIFGALGWRLYDLQVQRHAEFATDATKYIDGSMNWTTRRGIIKDGKGRQLATSLQVKSCAMDPKLAKASAKGLDGTIAELRKLLDLAPAEVDRIYRTASKDNSRFVWVKRKMSEAEAAKFEGAKLAGMMFPTEYVREYPQGQTAAHILGFSDIDGVGREGVENVCDTVLRGTGGSRKVWRDALGKQLTDDNDKLASDAPGLDVTLTIDSYIQTLVEKELAAVVDEYKAASACALVMDPQTGDILAMAGYPTYSPSAPADFPAKNRLNPVIASVFEPGSIFKPFVVAGALDAGVVTPERQFNCEGGAWRMPGVSRTLHDVHGYGMLSVEMIVAKSSNIGTAKVAAELGKNKLYFYLTAFGFGSKHGIPLQGEVTGTLRPVAKWDGYTMGSIPMGHEVTTTPLQIVTAYCALANGGLLLRPRLVKEIRKPDGTVVSTVPVTPLKRVVKATVTKQILSMLERTVQEGTGKSSKLNEYRVGGKTGTAQMVVNAAEIKAGHKGYSPTRYASSFVGVAPIEAPRVVVLVSVKEPKGAHYGGVVSGPTARNIISGTLQYLRVAPSKPVESVVGTGSPTVAAAQELEEDTL